MSDKQPASGFPGAPTRARIRAGMERFAAAGKDLSSVAEARAGDKPVSGDLVSEQVDSLRRRGPDFLADALDRSLRVLHRLADDHLDATPAVRQVATAAVADVRDLAEGGPYTEDLSEALGVDFGPPASRLELVITGAPDTLADAPWPTEDPGESA